MIVSAVSVPLLVFMDLQLDRNPDSQLAVGPCTSDTNVPVCVNPRGPMIEPEHRKW